MTAHFELTARQAMREIANGDLTVEALVRSCLERSAELEPNVGAWQHLDEAYAVAAAQAADKIASPGPLHGMLVGVKDVIDTVEMPTTYGSKAYAGHRPPYDAACVALFRHAGALALGKTVSTEFAAAAPGKTRHPFNPAHTPGGSSSGSAAAVAAKMVPVALGTQTAGSTIRPAAFCGVVGYKPTYGVIERTGVKTLAGSFDTVGVMAREVRDVAAFTAAVGGRPELVPSDAPATPRVAIYRTEAWHLALPETAAAIERAAGALSKKGAKVEELPLVEGYDDLLAIHEGVMDWEVLHALCYERLFLSDKIAPKTMEMFNTRMPKTSAKIYDAAVRRAKDARDNIEKLFGAYDVLLTPSAPGEAPPGLEKTGDASFNRIWTTLYAPCVTVPAGVGPTGLPVGVQIVGRPGDDARTLSAAAYLEHALAA